MIANFYNNESDERYLNKKIELLSFGNPAVSDIPIEIIEPSSIISPSFKLTSSLIGQKCNYVFISDLGRYYYIRNWTMMNGYIKVDCEVDVLMSFKDVIKEKNVIVSRQESKFNLFMDDNKYKVQNRTAIETLEFPNGFGTSKHIVMGVVGKKQES